MTVTTPRTLSHLQEAALEAVVYADVFDFPPTAAEVRAALPFVATQTEVTAALAALMPDLVEHRGSYYFLQGRESLVEVRRRRSAASAMLWPLARSYGGWIARLPFVRMVAVTGSLAVDNSEAGDDLDYLVVTKPGRLWLTRALTMLVVRYAGLRGVTICPNYFLAETALVLSQRDAYTARELVQMRPIAGGRTYARMLEANTWLRDLLPNAGLGDALPASRQSVLARAGEMFLGGAIGARLESWLQRRKLVELCSQAPDNAEAVFSADICKGHFDAYGARTRAAVAERMRRLLGSAR